MYGGEFKDHFGALLSGVQLEIGRVCRLPVPGQKMRPSESPVFHKHVFRLEKLWARFQRDLTMKHWNTWPCLPELARKQARPPFYDLSSRDWCACGNLKTKKSKSCSGCPRQLIPRINCAVCRIEFQPKCRQRKCCSDRCGQAYVAALMTSRMKPDPTGRRLRLRMTRRRGSEMRRARGWQGGRKAVGRWRLICERDGWMCWICRKEIDRQLLPPHRHAGTADHVVPISKGGSDDEANLRAAHFSCNARRGAGKFYPVVVS
jgi:hypothetical protein